MINGFLHDPINELKLAQNKYIDGSFEFDGSKFDDECEKKRIYSIFAK